MISDFADEVHERRLEAGSIVRQVRRVLAETPVEPDMPLAIPLRTGWRVYVIRNLHGDVLYVGMTKLLWRRIGEHSKKAAWWDEAASVVSFPCANKARAASMERQLIGLLHPTHNKAA